MIDAISTYSFNHASLKTNLAFKNSKKSHVLVNDGFVKEKNNEFQSEIASFLGISACAGAFCMILNFLLNSESLFKTDFSAIRSILKASALVAIVSGGCFAGFKSLEKLIDSNQNTK